MKLADITLTPKDIRRFWKFARSGTKRECWLWTGGGSRDGYGSFRLRNRCWGAHRVAFKMMVSEMKEGLEICHKCDNPTCVNPYHLFQGTHGENIKDSFRKGRTVIPNNAGVTNPHARLTNTQVMEIFNSDQRQDDIAAKYGVGQAHVSRIKRGQAWSHLTGKFDD